MSRTKGSLNKKSTTISPYSLLESNERANLLVNLIVDLIIEDQGNNQELLKRITRLGYGKSIRS